MSMQQNEYVGNTYACNHHSYVHMTTVLVKSIRTLSLPNQQFEVLQIYSQSYAAEVGWNKRHTKQ